MIVLGLFGLVLVLTLVGLTLGLLVSELPSLMDNYIEGRRKWDEYKKQRRFDAEEPVKVAKPRKR